jgi:predicted RNA methylase
MYRRFSTAVLFLGLVAAAAPCSRAADPETRPPARESGKADVVYVPTPNDVVNKMLDLAKVTKDDVVYDLGCGDCRIPVRAAKRFGCKAVGYDIDPQRVKESTENIKKNGVQKLVKVEQEDIFKLDLKPASVVTLYLLPSLNVKLIPQLDKLKDGSRIVSHDFDMHGVKPDKVVRMVSKEDNQEHIIYLWTIPLNKEKDSLKEDVFKDKE